MGIYKVINLTLMFLGAIVMLVSITLARSQRKLLPYVTKRQQKSISMYLTLHHAFMVFFFFGYVAVIISFFLQYQLVTESFVSIIFFLGAAFVCLEVISNTRLLSELQGTLQGILPICAKCKKIRTKNGDTFDQSIWKDVDVYISSKTDVDFTHGYCPQCFHSEMEKMDEIDKS